MPRTPRQSRRTFLKTTGVAATGAAFAGTSSGAMTTASTNGWTEVESPTGKTIYEVVMTKEEPYAVAAGGDVLARRADGWELVLEKGPTVQSNPLRGAGVTDDGKHVWFVGGSGVVGLYDVDEEQLTDYSPPKGKTSTWEGIAVGGGAGNENIYLINGSGEVLTGQNDSGAITWGDVVKPGGGSSMKAIDLVDDTTAYIVDTNAKVYETKDGGSSWNTVGIDGGSVGLYGVAALTEDDINVTGGDGSIFRYNGAVWTKNYAGGNALYGIDRTSENGLVGGGSGTIFELTEDGWEQDSTPVSNTLRDAVVGESGPDVAVGGSGTIIERRE
ncbi:twin-arginine translocation signal domain-containing protein [Haladaptatus sp. NG-SE-30]